MIRLPVFTRLLPALLFIFALVGITATGTGSGIAQTANVEIAKRARHQGDVYLVRGGFNVFSRGLDDMAQTLKKRGVKAQVISHRSSDGAVDKIIANRKKFGRKPVVLIGHSLGANAIIRMATKLRKSGIAVTYMVTFAATKPDPIPRNVRKATNYYFKTDGWGEPVTKARGARANLKNIDLSNTDGVHHFNIEKNKRLQRQVIRNVLRFVRANRSA